MKSKHLMPVIFMMSLFLFANCKREDPKPTAKIEATDQKNQFDINGDGFTNSKAEIDTSITTYGETNALLYQDIDSLQLKVCGTTSINGVQKNVIVSIVAHYTGAQVISISNYLITNISIAFVEINGGQIVYTKEYVCSSGTLEFSESSISGYVQGTYSGTFEVDNNPNNTVTITNGEFISKVSLVN